MIMIKPNGIIKLAHIIPGPCQAIEEAGIEEILLGQVLPDALQAVILCCILQRRVLVVRIRIIEAGFALIIGFYKPALHIGPFYMAQSAWLRRSR